MSAEYEPLSHGEQSSDVINLSSVENVPPTHKVQFWRSVPPALSRNVPAGHGKHREEASTLLYVPFGHNLQSSSSSCPENGVYLPRAQSKQAEAPIVLLAYLPLAQSIHSDTASAPRLDELFPLGQSLQSDSDVFPTESRYLPAAHLLHAVAFGELE